MSKSILNLIFMNFSQFLKGQYIFKLLAFNWKFEEKIFSSPIDRRIKDAKKIGKT